MKEFVVDNKNEGKKFFRFIKTILPGLKNGEIFKLLRKKIILVNGQKTSLDYVLQSGDLVSIYLKDEHFSTKGKSNKFFSINTDLDIVFEDENLLVINKASGLLVHPSKSDYKNNLYEMVRSYLFQKKEYEPSDLFSPTPCHRLDKYTSGIIVFAKNHSTLKDVTKKFRERNVVKKYYAIACGKLHERSLLTSYIDAGQEKVIVSKFKALSNIPEKNTFFENNPDVSATLIDPEKIMNNYTLLKIDLWTGKKHQIRAHLKEIGHPLLGDKKYFSKKSLYLSKELGIKHFFLHSYSLKINGYDEWSAPIPDNFCSGFSC